MLSPSVDTFAIRAKAIAHHEAAHATTLWVAARRLNLSIPNASILSVQAPSADELRARLNRYINSGEDGGFSGVTEYDNEGWLKSLPDMRPLAEALAVQCLAGCVAEHRVMRAEGMFDGSLQEFLRAVPDDKHLSAFERDEELRAGRPLSDIDRMRLFADGAERSEYQILKKTRECIYNGRIWRAIEVFANILLSRCKVSGDEAAAVIRDAWGH